MTRVWRLSPHQALTQFMFSSPRMENGKGVIVTLRKYFWNLMKDSVFYFKGIIIRGFSSPVLLKLSGDGVSGCFLFVLHFSVHFTFPILSLSLPRGWSFRLKLSHCLVKTNLTEQQGFNFNFFPSLIWKLYPLLQQHKSISSISCCC